MAFSRLSADVQNIAKLDDEPNDVGGMTAAELKAAFDQAGVDIKTFVNLLASELEARSAAGNIGIETLQGGEAGHNTVQEMIQYVFEQASAAQAGTIVDGSITQVKLADGAVQLASAKVGGILPEAKGGTGYTSFLAAHNAAFANHPLVLSDEQRGPVLPDSPVEGQVFFLEVT